jgi:hypothetical protein
MTRISIPAVLLAFLAEYIADNIIDTVLLLALAQGSLSGDLDADALKKAGEAVMNSREFLLGGVIFGSATTVGGGYLAARLAKTFPYYNGLGVGLVGVVFSIIVWGDQLWLNLLAILTTVPLSIYGAHLAKRHMNSAAPPA